MESSSSSTQRGVTYAYESLLDEHFQHLVQTLLLKEFPGLQCTPVGMPDGGRDAFTSSAAKPDYVFQVKFSRNPSAIKDVYAWIVSAIDGEKAKIDELADRGATKYYLVTNVPGTSHLDVGLIDKVNKYLNDNVRIESQCLWRDDLDRRLDGEYDVKLRFPHILNGPDLLRLVWESAGNRTLAQSRDTLEAYLKDQYKTDEHLRFKQVEMLTTKLFDLYIDVPILPISPGRIRAGRELDIQGARELDPLRITARIAAMQNGAKSVSTFQFSLARDRLGAATLLSDPLQLSNVTRLVIEGAPGQGKTTLSQYLAQIQRARYLGKQDVLNNLPAEHTRGPALLPLKIELRDLAHWLNGRDPWSPKSNTKHGEIESLESALAGHIRRYSGGNLFAVEDLRNIIKSTPTLLILDALDEVADLGDRKAVISEIDNAIERLDSDSGNLVVLVTSRPTAISNAPRLDRSRFIHYSLQAIHASLALSYAERWSRARGIPSRDARELQNILKNKLDSTHMAELAKNTMQLTILLSLVLSRGSSLPDKRTELYSAYLEQFLSRESDKSPDVRENRALIMDLHGYLAYYLHARAEGQRTTGRISADDLEQQVRHFLEREGQDLDLQDKIFHAVVQRVVALVSRVEGTFEFEVQPLREYFVARHLYHTAPYSPTGQERRGTKPDRFDGIAPNPYWMNVTRFYAGFFSKGELMDLAHRVCELMTHTENSMNPFPRRLALALLQDWVFSQVPPAVKMVVETLLNADGLVWISNSRAYSGGRFHAIETEDFQLWPGGGGAEYAAAIFWERIIVEDNDEWRALWCALFRSVSSRAEAQPKWTEHYNAIIESRERSRWLQVGELLGLMDSLGAAEFSRYLDIEVDDDLTTRALAVRHSPKHFNDLPAEQQKKYMRAILNHGSLRPIEDINFSAGAGLARFFFLSHPFVWQATLFHTNGLDIPRPVEPGAVFENENDLLQVALGGDVLHSLTPWIEAVAAIDALFGQSLTTIELSCMSAAIRSSGERGKAEKGLLRSTETPLPKRFRYARRQANKPGWWKKQFSDIESSDDVQILLLGLMGWAGAQTVAGLAPAVDEAIGMLSREARAALVRIVQVGQHYSRNRESRIPQTGIKISLLESLSLEAILLIAERSSGRLLEQIVDHILVQRLPHPDVARCVFPVVASRLSRHDVKVESNLETLRLCAADSDGERLYLPPFPPGRSARGLVRDFPYELVIESGLKLPPNLVSRALDVAIRSSRRRYVPVFRTATKQGWFDTGIGG